MSCSKETSTESDKIELNSTNSEIIKGEVGEYDSSKIKNDELHAAYNELLKAYPDDSISIHKFYHKWLNRTNSANQQRYVSRLERLTTGESVLRYKTVQRDLKPLLMEIVKNESVNLQQLEYLVRLYSDYDFFSGEALFSDLLTNDDNYNLVWNSFRIVAKESSKDTTYITSLIALDYAINTNVELAEGMTGFVIKSIQNNPHGFLKMYLNRKPENRNSFSNHIYYYDTPDSLLISAFQDISNNSNKEKYRKAAKMLLNNINSGPI